MPELISGSIHPRDLSCRRQQFKRLPIGQVFYADRAWWQKRTRRTAVPASCDGKADYFAFNKWCWVPAEDGISLRPRVTYEDFLRQSAL